MLNTSTMVRIGHISAWIGDDMRYPTRIEVFVEGDRACVVRSESAAAGGMDGPGGSTDPGETGRVETTASPKDILKAVRCLIDSEVGHTVKRYGKPTVRFRWAGIDRRGLSVSLVTEALAFLRGEGESDG